jgi:hypothetical protein
LLLDRELRDEELRLELLRAELLRLAAGLRALRDPDLAALAFDALPRDDVLFDAVLFDPERFDAELFDAELRLAPLFAAVRRLALRPLRVALAPVLFAALVTDAAAFSRFLISDWFVLRASVRSVRSAAATSLYAVRALPPRSLRIVCSADVASSSAFSKRLVACSTSLRVAALAELARRVAGFFAGGMWGLLLVK